MLVGLPRLVIICRTQGRRAHLLVADLTLQAPAGDAAKGEHWAAAATGCWQPPWECRPCSRWRAIAMHQGCCGVSEGLRSGGQQWPGGAGSSNPCASPLPAARSAGGWHQGPANDHNDGRQQALDRLRRPPCRPAAAATAGGRHASPCFSHLTVVAAFAPPALPCPPTAAGAKIFKTKCECARCHVLHSCRF